MSHKEKFKEMAMDAKDAIEDFHDFADDQALSWAYDEIKRLEKLAHLAEGLRITKSEDMGIFLHFETASGTKSGLRLDTVGIEWALEKLADKKL